MFQDGQDSAPRTLRRMASMFQDGQLEQTSSPRMLRRTTSTYQDGHYEVPRSPRMLASMGSVYQEPRSPAPPPRMARQMPTSLYPDDLLAPRMTMNPSPRRASFYDGSQFEGGGSLAPNGLHQECPKMTSMFEVAHSKEKIKSLETKNLHQECPKLSPIPPKKMTSMFEVARSLEKMKSFETNNLSPETKVNQLATIKARMRKTCIFRVFLWSSNTFLVFHGSKVFFGCSMVQKVFSGCSMVLTFLECSMVQKSIFREFYGSKNWRVP